MKYSDYAYLWPPRPETAIAPPMLSFYEKRKYIAQKKKNGTCTLVFTKGDQVIFKTRHNEDHKLWTPTPEHVEFFRGFDDWNVFVGELLHSKVAGGPKNELYLFDQIVRDGRQLVGESFYDRFKAMEELLPKGVMEEDQFRLSPHITLAKNFTTGFARVFSHLKKEDEGLVLKDPKAPLKLCLKPDSNKSWQVKCRIPHKNYTF